MAEPKLIHIANDQYIIRPFTTSHVTIKTDGTQVVLFSNTAPVYNFTLTIPEGQKPVLTVD